MKRTGLISGLMVLLCVFGFNSGVFAQSGKVTGKVESGEAVSGAIVKLYYADDPDGPPIKGAQTDENGWYEIALVEPGTYIVKTFYSGIVRKQEAVVVAGISARLNFDMSFEQDVVKIYPKPPFDVDPIQPEVIDGDEFRAMAGNRDPLTALASTKAGVFQSDEGDGIIVRGARAGATATFIDGVRQRGTYALPQAAVGNISLIPAGLPAQYGDVLGGVVLIETRNPGMRGWKVYPELAKAKAAKKRAKQLKKQKNNPEGHSRELGDYLSMR